MHGALPTQPLYTGVENQLFVATGQAPQKSAIFHRFLAVRAEGFVDTRGNLLLMAGPEALTYPLLWLAVPFVG